MVAGGVLFAADNLMHPLEHSDAAMASPLWAPAHVTSAVGGVLAAAGLPVVSARFARSRVGLVGLALLWVGLVMLPVGAFLEVWVAPVAGMERAEAISGSPVVATLIGVPILLGPVLVAVAALRHRLLHPLAAIAFAAFSVLSVGAAALPHELQGLGIIPGSVALGAALAAAGRVSRRS